LLRRGGAGFFFCIGFLLYETVGRLRPFDVCFPNLVAVFSACGVDQRQQRPGHLAGQLAARRSRGVGLETVVRFLGPFRHLGAVVRPDCGLDCRTRAWDCGRGRARRREQEIGDARDDLAGVVQKLGRLGGLRRPRPRLFPRLAEEALDQIFGRVAGALPDFRHGGSAQRLHRVSRSHLAGRAG
jgi:hypothetical protein